MALTWRNVDAPDFGRSLEGIRTFSNLFGDAVGGLDRGLAVFDAAQDKRANTAFNMDLLKYQDPAAYKAALTSGSLFAGVDPRRLSQATIQAAGTRVNDLMNQRLAGVQADAAEFSLGVARDDRSADMNNAAAAASYLTTGKGNLSDFKGFGTGRLMGIAKDRQGYVANDLGMDQTRLGMDQTRQGMKFADARFNWETEDRAVADQAENVWAGLQKNGFDPDSMALMLNEMKGVNPKVYNALISRIGAGGGGGNNASAMLSAASGGGSDPLRIMNYEARAAGFASVPDSVQTLGQASDYAIGLNRQGVKSSAMGVYQIVGDTMRRYAPKVLGDDWRNQPLNFDSQDKIAQAIFNDNRGSADALRKQWVSLSAADAERVRKMPWEQARQEIAARESKSDPRALALGLAASKQGTTNQRMVRDSNSLAPEYAKAAGDKRGVADVAGAEAGKGAFAGLNVGQLNEQIRLVQAEGRRQNITINPAVAASILRNATASSGASRLLGSITGGWVGGDSSGQYIDQDAVKRYVSELGNGALDNAVMAEANTQQAEAAQNNAQAMLAAATARLQRATVAQARGVKVDLAPLQGDVNRAGAMLAAATGAVAGNPANARFFRPPPQPVGTSRGGGKGPLIIRPKTREELWLSGSD